MTLPASGALSLSQLAAEYGGTAPHSLSEYYRNGPYVPNSVIVREPVSGYFPNSTIDGVYSGDNVIQGQCMMNGSGVADPIGSVDLWVGYSNDGGASYASPLVSVSLTSANLRAGYTYNGYTYYAKPGAGFTLSIDLGKGNFIYYTYWKIYRVGGATPVNQSVPTSGTLSLSKFYGGRKT